MNAKYPDWNSSCKNTAGRALRSYADRASLEVIGPAEPTFYGIHGNSDVLDIAILKRIGVTCEISTEADLSSDHNPVLLEVGVTPDLRRPVRLKTRWQEYTRKVETDLPCLGVQPKTAVELDIAVKEFEDCLTSSKVATSQAIVWNRAEGSLPCDIMELIREKRKARKRYQCTGDPEHKRQSNALDARVRESLAELSDHRWQQELVNMDYGDNGMWRKVREIREDRPTLPPLKSPTGLLVTDIEKAEALATTFERQCRTPTANTDASHIIHVENHVRSFATDITTDQVDEISVEEVTLTLKACDPRKSPGPDGITGTMLRQLPSCAIKHLTILLNAVLTLGYFPGRWKIADVIFIKKPLQPADKPESYRPISLLPAIGKVAEKLALRRMKDEIERLNIIPNEQFGFRESHSTELQITRVAQRIKLAWEMKLVFGAIFLDVSKAFDRVWHEGLIYKLLKTGMNKQLVRLIHSFISERRFRAKVNETRSIERNLTAGVPQGAVMSPTLYSVYVADTPKHHTTELALYADDTAYLACHKQPKYITRRLQASLHLLEDWLRLWRTEVNPAKSVAMLFTRKPLVPDGQLMLYGNPVPWQQSVKYLGAIMDKGLRWSDHIQKAATSARQAWGCLQLLTSRRSSLSRENKLLIYTAAIRPAMTYGMMAWAKAAVTHINKLQVVQNKALRVIARAPWYVSNKQLHDELAVPLIADYLKTRCNGQLKAATAHSNPLVREFAELMKPF